MRYNQLILSERLVIKFSMYLRRKYLKGTGLPDTLKRRIRCIFRKNHILYYLTLIKPGFTRNARGLILCYGFLRTEENLRLLLISLKTSNSVGFYSALRSQLELQAFLNYLLDNKEYFREFLKLNEDRKIKNDPNLVRNVITLLQKISIRDDRIMHLYEHLSLLLHPNPSALFETSNIRALHPQSGRFAHMIPVDMFFEYTWRIDKDFGLDIDLWVNIMCLRINDTFEVIKKISTTVFDSEISSFDFKSFIELKDEVRNRCGFPHWGPIDISKG